eukprot:3354868-Amphidinium_carterae.1
MGFVQPTLDTSDIVQAVIPPDAEVEVEDADELHHEHEPKRKKNHVDEVIKDWFLDFAREMAELKKWSFARSFQEATRLCPEPLAQ